MILQRLWRRIAAPIDPFLFVLVVMLICFTTVVQLSASPDRWQAQMINTAVGLVVLWTAANVTPQLLQRFALPLYVLGVLLLVAVALFGQISKGAQRWLDLGVMRIQPSELLKIAMPLMLAWYFQLREGSLAVRDFLVAGALLAVPVGLIAKQPDLGTAILVLSSGLFVIFFAGLSWKLIAPVLLAGVVGVGAIIATEDRICAPEVQWPGLREYQKHRICTLLDPTSDPLGKGFHTIQSEIAIGSGGVLGKGWRNGTQTQLEFIPERHTDFVFAVVSEEFGLLGNVGLLFIFLLVIMRGLMIAANGATVFGRLLAGAISLSFFTYVFVNMGMVTGILPVVGVPLPLVSYGGTALVTLCLGLGILMSVARHRTLLQK
ncbi:rod shape-determining protein RodA [Niveibacterium umoris]|uniref:Peptidoglycan glycosyltransferase MrdB n=1 Tax=Niveibacterium umoris TaxID=1193620 RepID=A0A840BRA9_9RHOO|nr:rod shape-determining protein RodA [Niveibacterium umoris]MBB4014212.1 rod shape determining protein RodA [Niveibacterium umoris]